MVMVQSCMRLSWRWRKATSSCRPFQQRNQSGAYELRGLDMLSCYRCCRFKYKPQVLPGHLRLELLSAMSPEAPEAMAVPAAVRLAEGIYSSS